MIIFTNRRRPILDIAALKWVTRQKRNSYNGVARFSLKVKILLWQNFNFVSQRFLSQVNFKISQNRIAEPGAAYISRRSSLVERRKRRGAWPEEVRLGAQCLASLSQRTAHCNQKSTHLWKCRVAVISAKKHKRQRRKRQSVNAKREKSQTPKFITAIQT